MRKIRFFPLQVVRSLDGKYARELTELQQRALYYAVRRGRRFGWSIRVCEGRISVVFGPAVPQLRLGRRKPRIVTVHAVSALEGLAQLRAHVANSSAHT